MQQPTCYSSSSSGHADIESHLQRWQCPSECSLLLVHFKSCWLATFFFFFFLPLKRFGWTFFFSLQGVFVVPIEGLMTFRLSCSHLSLFYGLLAISSVIECVVVPRTVACGIIFLCFVWNFPRPLFVWYSTWPAWSFVGFGILRWLVGITRSRR